MDDVGRAVGSGSGVVTIAGKVCDLRPLTVRELVEVDRMCVKHYVRQMLEVYSENLDLFPEESRSTLLERKTDELSRWTSSDLPTKGVYDPDRLVLNVKLKVWLTSNMPDFIQQISKISNKAESDAQYRHIIATCLENGTLPEKTYKELTNVEPRKNLVNYVNWWITGDFEGMITLIWICFRHAGVTKDEITRELTTNPDIAIHVAREIESLSAPAVGNG